MVNFCRYSRIIANTMQIDYVLWSYLYFENTSNSRVKKKNGSAIPILIQFQMKKLHTQKIGTNRLLFQNIQKCFERLVESSHIGVVLLIHALFICHVFKSALIEFGLATAFIGQCTANGAFNEKSNFSHIFFSAFFLLLSMIEYIFNQP